MDFRSDKEVVASFIEESTDRAREIENGLLDIEKSGFAYDDGLVHGLFRSAHSIKAGANLLDLHVVEDLAHRLENVLQALRKRELVPTSDTITTLLETLDAIRMLVEDMDNEASYDVSEHIEKLDQLLG